MGVKEKAGEEEEERRKPDSLLGLGSPGNVIFSSEYVLGE